MTSDPVALRDDGALIRLRVSPNARTSGPRGLCGDAALRMVVAAPPVDGRANAEVERFLAERTGVLPSRVRVVRGLSGKDGTVFVEGVGAESVREPLAARPR